MIGEKEKANKRAIKAFHHNDSETRGRSSVYGAFGEVALSAQEKGRGNSVQGHQLCACVCGKTGYRERRDGCRMRATGI